MVHFHCSSCFSVLTKIVSVAISLSLAFQPISSYAQTPVPAMVSAPIVSVNVKGLTVHVDNPFQFDFIIDSGSSDGPSTDEAGLRDASRDLIRYFLTTLTIPDGDMWVNLSPAEPERIMPSALAQTSMGRQLLEQDYQLKRLTASLLNPESDSGRKFWEGVYEKMYEDMPSAILRKKDPSREPSATLQDDNALHPSFLREDTYVPSPLRGGLGRGNQLTETPTLASPVKGEGNHSEEFLQSLHKVWIVPAKAVIHRQGSTVLIVENRLKVMLEGDYLSEVTDHEEQVTGTEKERELFVEDILRQTILPLIEEEVNNGETFAELRRIYNAMLLATWFKRNLKESFLSQVYINHNKIEGVDSGDPQAVQRIYDRYVSAFQTGAADLIKEDYDPVTQQTVTRRYFTGGLENYDDAQLAESSEIDAASLIDTRDHVVTWTMMADQAMLEENGPYKREAAYVLSWDGQLTTGYEGNETVVTYQGRPVSLTGFHLKDVQRSKDLKTTTVIVSPEFLQVLRTSDINSPITVNRKIFGEETINFIADEQSEIDAAMLAAPEIMARLKSDMVRPLTEEHRKIYEAMREFAQKEIAPYAQRIDQDDDINSKIVQKILDFLTQLLYEGGPTAVGAAFADNPDTITEVIMTLLISEASEGVALIYDVWNALTAFPLWYAGTKAQKKEFLEALLKGEVLFVFGLTERDGAGSNAIRGMTSKAVWNPSRSKYTIKAAKHYITGAQSRKAKYIIVFVDVDPQNLQAPQDPADRTGAFIVQLRDAQGNPLPGVTIDKQKALGHHGSGTSEVVLDNVEVSPTAVLGENWLTLKNKNIVSGTDQFRQWKPKIGAGIIGKTLEAGRISISAIALGAQLATIEELARIYQEKESQNLWVGHEKEKWNETLERLSAEFLAGWHMILKVARMKDAGESYNLEAGVLKLTTTEAAVRNAMTAMRLAGAEYVKPDSVLERINRDNKLLTIGEGTTQTMRNLIINELRRRLGKDREYPVHQLFHDAAGEEKNLIDQYAIDIHLRQSVDDYTDERNATVKEVLLWQMADIFAWGMVLKTFREAESGLLKAWRPVYANQVVADLLHRLDVDQKTIAQPTDLQQWSTDQQEFVTAGLDFAKGISFDDDIVSKAGETLGTSGFSLENETNFLAVISGIAEINLPAAIAIADHEIKTYHSPDDDFARRVFVEIAQSAGLAALKAAEKFASERTVLTEDGREIKAIEMVQVRDMLLNLHRFRISSMANGWNWDLLARTFMEAADAVVQIYGGAGYMAEGEAAKFWTRAMDYSIRQMSRYGQSDQAMLFSMVNQDAYPVYEVLEGKVMALQGVGNVGGLLIDPLLNSGVKLIASDVDPQKIEAMKSKYARVIEAGRLFLFAEEKTENGYTFKIINPLKHYPDIKKKLGISSIDVFIPAAVGRVVNDQTIPELREAGVKFIIGSANDALADREKHAPMLGGARILYVPDYHSNFGGVRGVDAFLRSEEMFQDGNINFNPIVSEARLRTINLLKMAENSGQTLQSEADRQARFFFDSLPTKREKTEALNLNGQELGDGTKIRVFTSPEDLEGLIRHRWDDHYAVFELSNETLGYTAYISIHRLTQIQGQVDILRNQYRATGGTRMRQYSSNIHAMEDALELSKEMSFKTAGAGLPIGGSKCTINVKIDPSSAGAQQSERKDIIISYAKAIEYIGSRIGGGVLTGQDMNISVEDARLMFEHAPTSIVPYVAEGYSIEPTPPTAVGVYNTIGTVLEYFNKAVEDNASLSVNPGGIDLDGSKIEMDVRGTDQSFEFKIDPAMIKRLQSPEFKGFYPFIINIRPIVQTPLYSELTGDMPDEADKRIESGMDLTYLKEW